MAEAIWPGIMMLEETTIDVETKGEITDGMTVMDPRDRRGIGRNSWVAWTIDGDDFHSRLRKALGKLAEPFRS
jgi:inosine-uridine nucleoside N-ribohydrolase